MASMTWCQRSPTDGRPTSFHITTLPRPVVSVRAKSFRQDDQNLTALGNPERSRPLQLRIDFSCPKSPEKVLKATYPCDGYSDCPSMEYARACPWRHDVADIARKVSQYVAALSGFLWIWTWRLGNRQTVRMDDLPRPVSRSSHTYNLGGRSGLPVPRRTRLDALGCSGQLDA
jgi:hypothetical protein